MTMLDTGLTMLDGGLVDLTHCPACVQEVGFFSVTGIFAVGLLTFIGLGAIIVGLTKGWDP